MSDREVKRLTPNSIANLVMADETWHDSLYVKAEDYDSLLADFEALRTALAAETPKHPGYIIGSHWLETAYSRVCAGEAEADVLRDCGWERVDDIEALRRENERLREFLLDIRKDAATSHWHRDIDAALRGEDV